MPPSPDSAVMPDGDGVRLHLHVHPGARRSGFNGFFGPACKLDLQAPPVDGKANAELIRFLAGFFHVAKSSVGLLSGVSSRDKIIRISGISPETAFTLLNRKQS